MAAADDDLAPEALRVRTAELLRTEGLTDPAARLDWSPLYRDIWLVSDAQGGRWCVERVPDPVGTAQDRTVPEGEWLRVVGGWYPDRVPHLVAEDRQARFLIRSYLAPPTWRPWREVLDERQADPTIGHHLGEFVGALHARSAADPELAARFADRGRFRALRIDPFVRTAMEAHPDLRAELKSVEADLESGARALVHGDLRPARVLVRDDGFPLLLGPPCAWWGAPHFDSAFFLAHVMLRWARRPDPVAGWLTLARSFRAAWMSARGGEAGDSSDVRTTLLIPALLLARVDAAPPRTPLLPERGARVRSFARTQVRARPEAFDTLLTRFERMMGDID